MLTQERLKSLLEYDPATGAFTWRVQLSNRAPVGRRAGWINGSGYRHIHVDGVGYKASRLAVLYMTGEWPAALVDHRNRQRHDDRWGNLRAATKKQNQENTDVGAANRSGFKGVYWQRQRQCWNACIRHVGRSIHLGSFGTIVDAVAARIGAERRLFTHSPAGAA